MAKKTIIAKKDATLPKTRFAQLGDIIKNDFSLVVDICLFNLLFSSILIILFVFEYLSFMSLSSYEFEKVFPIVFYFGLMEIIPFAIKGIGKGASYSLLKKRIFNEGCMLSATFFKNIKENYKHYFVMYLLVGISFWISSSGIIYFIYLNANSFIKGFGIGILLLYFILRYVAAEYYLIIDNLYVLKIKDGIKNAYSFVFSSIFVSIIYTIIALVIPITLIIINYYVMIIFMVIYLLFYDGFLMLIANLYTYTLCDKYINKDNYKDYVNKGLYKED